MWHAEGPAEAGPYPSGLRDRSPREPYRKTIVFVAHSGMISRALDCAIRAEFPWLSVKSVADPVEVAVTTGGDVPLIVLAHQICRDPAVIEIARRHTHAGIAVMVDKSVPFPFWDLLRTVPMRGILPMNVNLDIWLSILRIMLHGGTYLPPELVLPSLFDGRPQAGIGPAPQARQTRRPSSVADRKPQLPVRSSRSGGDDIELAGFAGSGFTPLTDRVAVEVPTRDPVVARRPVQSSLDRLTVREHEVLHMVSRGCQNKIIALELNLAENTVKIHLHNIIRKLAVSNRTQAAARYLKEIEAGRVSLPEVAARHP